MTTERCARIRVLNDQLRQQHAGGRIFLTQGVMELGDLFVAASLMHVAKFSDFSPDNDPYGEHDFGAVTVGAKRVFWKIDYYDQSLTSCAVDPAEPTGCVRVMTIMLAEEY